MLRSMHMDIVPIRELQQHSSAVLRSVRAGEQVGTTDRGPFVVAGRVRPGTVSISDLPPGRKAPMTISEVLDDLRADR